MLKFLIPFDGSEPAQRAVVHVIRIARLGGEPRVLVLNVREPADSWQIRSFLNQEEIAQMQQSEGEADLRRARELLDEAGVAYRTLVAAGPIAQTIAEVAEREEPLAVRQRFDVDPTCRPPRCHLGDDVGGLGV